MRLKISQKECFEIASVFNNRFGDTYNLLGIL